MLVLEARKMGMVDDNFYCNSNKDILMMLLLMLLWMVLYVIA